MKQVDIIKLYRKRLKEYIYTRIEELSIGKIIPKITGIKITSAKTRW